MKNKHEIDYKSVKLSDKGYMSRALNGVCTLFEWYGYTFAEGDNYDRKPQTSYFIFDPTDVPDCKAETYLISESDMFELVKMYYCYNKDVRDELIEQKLIDLCVITFE
jgi:hypothetical protein